MDKSDMENGNIQRLFEAMEDPFFWSGTPKKKGRIIDTSDPTKTVIRSWNGFEKTITVIKKAGPGI